MSQNLRNSIANSKSKALVFTSAKGGVCVCVCVCKISKERALKCYAKKNNHC